MASISFAQTGPSRHYGVPGSWSYSSVLPESRLDASLRPVSSRQPHTALESPKMRSSSKLHLKKDSVQESSVEHLLLSFSNMQIPTDYNANRILVPENDGDNSASAGSSVAQPRLPVIRRGERSCRLASSRRLTTTSNDNVFQHSVPHTPPIRIPGELLEQDSLVSAMRRRKAPAVDVPISAEDSKSPGTVEEKKTTTSRVRHFRRWSHFAGFSARLRRKDAKEPENPGALQTNTPQMDDEIVPSTSSSRILPSRFRPSRFSAPVASSFHHTGSAMESSWIDLSPSSPTAPPVNLGEAPSPRDSPTIKASRLVKKEAETQTPKPDISKANCTVCNDRKPSNHFPASPITSNCTHPTRTCSECVQKWIETTIENHGWDQSKCPDCNSVLTHDDVKRLATPEVFARYDHLATRAALSAIPNFRWCQRPGCTSGQIHNGSEDTNPIFTCISCSFTYCLNHPNPPFHFGETCAQFDVRQAGSKRTAIQILQEKRSEQLVQETSKRCPNAVCGWWIEKMEGCDHMTCVKCRFEFCWLCCAAFEPIRRKGNRFHKVECKYYG